MDSLIKAVSDYGTSFGFITLLFGIFGLIIYLRFKEPFISLLKGDHKSQAKHTPLDTHDLFSTIQKMLVIEIPNLELLPSKPIKQQMFRDILQIFVKTIYEECQEISKIDRDDWTPEKWVLEMSKHANKIVSTFNTACISDGIPLVVINKFSKWNQNTMELLYEHIATVGKADAYKSNNERTNTLFLVIGLLIVVTLGDAEKTIKELNGEVAGQLYKGMVIED